MKRLLLLFCLLSSVIVISTCTDDEDNVIGPESKTVADTDTDTKTDDGLYYFFGDGINAPATPDFLDDGGFYFSASTTWLDSGLLATDAAAGTDVSKVIQLVNNAGNFRKSTEEAGGLNKSVWTANGDGTLHFSIKFEPGQTFVPKLNMRSGWDANKNKPVAKTIEVPADQIDLSITTWQNVSIGLETDDWSTVNYADFKELLFTTWTTEGTEACNFSIDEVYISYTP